MLSTEEIRTSRLDDITEVGAIDLLKSDIQGGELMALAGGRAKLATAVAINIKVPFAALYRGQPTVTANSAVTALSCTPSHP